MKLVGSSRKEGVAKGGKEEESCRFYILSLREAGGRKRGDKRTSRHPPARIYAEGVKKEEGNRPLNKQWEGKQESRRACLNLEKKERLRGKEEISRFLNTV